MVALTMNLTNIQPDEGVGDPLGEGWYVAYVSNTDYKPTKDGTGAYLKCEFTVLEPQQQAKRKFFKNYNLQNTNQEAVAIAYRQLAALAHSINVLQFQDSVQLHNIPCKVRLSIRKGEGNYRDQNEVDKIVAMSQDVGPLGPLQPQQKTAPAFTPAPAFTQPVGMPGANGANGMPGMPPSQAPQPPQPPQVPQVPQVQPQAQPQAQPQMPAAPQLPQVPTQPVAATIVPASTPVIQQQQPELPPITSLPQGANPQQSPAPWMMNPNSQAPQ